MKADTGSLDYISYRPAFSAPRQDLKLGKSPGVGFLGLSVFMHSNNGILEVDQGPSCWCFSRSSR